MKKTFLSAIVASGLILAYSLPGYAWHGGHFRGSIWIGPGWGPWWGPGYPYYSYPYYAPPPVVVQQSPNEYIQQPSPQSNEPAYWYYCPDQKGYYPYVKNCPNGWLKVVPSPAQPDERE
jgi:hypothetical protein